MNKKVIIGLTGLLASGKGAASKYLEKKYGASTFRFSSILRDICQRAYLEKTRDNLVKLSECLRATFGEDLLAKAIAKDAESNNNQIVIVDGIRRMADIVHLKSLPNFILVAISADSKIRYERLIKRGENSDDVAKTYEQFLADHELSTEKSILEVIPYAKDHIDNSGSIEKLYEQLDQLVTKYIQ